MNLGKAWLSSFIANSSPVLIKKLPQPWTSCWGNKEVIMFLNGLQLRVISPPILKLFAFLSLCSGWVEQALCFAKTTSRQVRHTADAFFWKAERSPFFAALSQLCSSLIMRNGKHSQLNSFFIFLIIVWLTELSITPSISYTVKSSHWLKLVNILT